MENNEEKIQTWHILMSKSCFLFAHKTTQKLLTTMRFHIFAASATVVQTVLQPAKSINFCGLLYSRLYITLAPKPGSHCKHKEMKVNTKH